VTDNELYVSFFYEAAALVGAGMLSVLVFPTIAGTLRAKT